MTSENWERRWHPLLLQWVIISANTKARPWSGLTTKAKVHRGEQHDQDCYLCPRVTRANGEAKRYDSLFKRGAPNITLLHNAPCDGDSANQHWHFHIAMQPPIRDPEKLKYLAGAEAGSNNIVNPLQPEHAALQLRECVIE